MGVDGYVIKPRLDLFPIGHCVYFGRDASQFFVIVC